VSSKAILIVSALLAALVGTAAALAASLFVQPDAASLASSSEVAVPVERESAVVDPQLVAALDDLKADNAMLRERVTSLETELTFLRDARTPISAGATALEADGGVSDRAVAAALAGSGGELSEVFVANVGQALREIRAEEEREREATRKERQSQRLEENLKALQESLGLSNYQVNEMRGVLVAQDDKRSALFASIQESGGDPRSAREGMRAIRDETHAALKTVLTPEQFEGYLQSDDFDFGGRGRGRDRGPAGGAPPGDGGGPPGSGG
jgi:hypothetical protein